MITEAMITCPECGCVQTKQLTIPSASNEFGVGVTYTCGAIDGYDTNKGCGVPLVIYSRCKVELKVKAIPEKG